MTTGLTFLYWGPSFQRKTFWNVTCIQIWEANSKLLLCVVYLLLYSHIFKKFVNFGGQNISNNENWSKYFSFFMGHILVFIQSWLYYKFMIDLIPDEFFIIFHHLLLQPIWLHTMNKQSSVTLLEFIVLIPDMYNMFVNVRNRE